MNAPFFNTNCLRNNINSIEYRKIFEKKSRAIVADTQLIPDKLKILNKLAKKNYQNIITETDLHL